MKVNLKRLAAQIAGLFVVFASVLFLAAGAIAWPAGWAFLVLFFGFVMAVSLWLRQNNPGLLRERVAAPKAEQAAWDRAFIRVINMLFIFWLVLMPMDAVRFQWSQMPVWLQATGALVLAASFFLFFLTFRENSYASSIVRIQTDRGQTVVTTGPYRYVRHPMYVAFQLFVLGTALLLGSWFGVLWGMTLIATVVLRAVLEERALRENLCGYDAYMERVRYRFIPYLW